MVGRQRLQGQVNYFLGATSRSAGTPTCPPMPKWPITTCTRAWTCSTRARAQLTYDFVLAPGAQPGAIRLTLDRTGALLLASGAGILRQEQPRAYQVVGGQRRAIAVRYILRGQSQVGLAVGRYDARQPLLIDPAVSLSYSTYLLATLTSADRPCPRANARR
jgi:hypothetical protein